MNLEVMKKLIEITENYDGTINSQRALENEEIKCYFIIVWYISFVEKLLKKNNQDRYILDKNLFDEYENDDSINKKQEFSNFSKYIRQIKLREKTKKTTFRVSGDVYKKNGVGENKDLGESDRNKNILSDIHLVRNILAHGSFKLEKNKDSGEWEIEVFDTKKPLEKNSKNNLRIPINYLTFKTFSLEDNISVIISNLKDILDIPKQDNYEDKYILLDVILTNLLNVVEYTEDNKYKADNLLDKFAFINISDIFINDLDLFFKYVSDVDTYNKNASNDMKIKFRKREFKTLYMDTYGKLETIVFMLDNINLNNIEIIKSTLDELTKKMSEYNFRVVRMIRNSIEHAEMFTGETNLGRVELVERLHRTEYKDTKMNISFNPLPEENSVLDNSKKNIKVDFLIEGTFEGILKIAKSIISAVTDCEKLKIEHLGNLWTHFDNSNKKENSKKLLFALRKNIYKIYCDNEILFKDEYFDSFFTNYMTEKSVEEFIADIENVYKNKKEKVNDLNQMFNDNDHLMTENNIKKL